MPATPSRTLARTVVTRVRERSAYAHETLDALLRRNPLPGRDAAFATRLAYGATAHRGTLEEVVANVSDPGTVLPDLVLDCLVTATYEILHLSTPARAAVSEGVELVRDVQPRAAGLANAVLRRVAAKAPEFPFGDPSSDLDALARAHGHPHWMVRLFAEERGHATAREIVAANDEPAPLFTVSLHEPEAVGGGDDAWWTTGPSACPLPGCRVARDPAAVRDLPALATREVLVMDAGAQFAARCVPLSAGGTVVEIGAGRGGKTLLMAARARAGGIDTSFVAVDLHAHKLEALERDAARLGLPVSTLAADAAAPGALQGAPGCASVTSVLVDAPCSGLGTLRRHPDRRWRARPADMESVAALGERMLHTAASLVPPGGFVVYSTCTITRRENDDVVDGFLSSAQGAAFVTDRLDDDVPPEWRSFVTPEGWFQSLPTLGGPDGHFVARLRRRV